MGHRVGLEAAKKEIERERERDRMFFYAGNRAKIPWSHNLLAEADRFPESDMQLSRTRCNTKFLRVVWVTVNSAQFRRQSTSKQRTW